LVNVNPERLKFDLYDRNGVLRDNVEIPAKRLPPYLMPPFISKVVPDKLTDVNIKNPITLTFSSDMDKASVESATGFSPAATVSYTWTNNYTVSIDIAQLNYETAYTLTINGSVAKNETGKFLAGDGNGTEGSNYVLNFTTAALDLNPPVVVSYDPQEIQEEALRPIVRIEFDKPLNISSILPGQITVTDNATGASIAGTQRHIEVNGRSVLHYFFTNDLTPGTTYKVELKAGLKDMVDNTMEEGLTYTFRARPREVNRTQVIDNFPSSLSGAGWWQPSESGQTAAVTADISSSTEIAYSANATSMRLNYVFTESSGLIRLHRRGNPRFTKHPNTSVQFYLLGDASNSRFRISARAGGSDGSGVLWSCIPIVVDWAGWKQITWDLYDSSKGQEWLSAVGGTIADGTEIDVKDIGLHPATPFSNTPSFLLIDELVAVELGDYIYKEVGVKNPLAESGINVYTANGHIQIDAPEEIKAIRIYSIVGASIKATQPELNSYQIPTNDLIPGVYIVNVITETSQKNVKVFVQ